MMKQPAREGSVPSTSQGALAAAAAGTEFLSTGEILPLTAFNPKT